MNCAKGAYFSSCRYFLSCLTTFGFAVRLITAPFIPGGDFGFSLGRGSNPSSSVTKYYCCFGFVCLRLNQRHPRTRRKNPKSHHGFSTTKPITMWDSTMLQVIKTINVDGSPDGILFDPSTERVWVFSHTAPNATVIDAREGTVVGTLDLGGQPEQAASDGKGTIYVNISDKENVAVIDAKKLAVTAH